MSGGQLGGILHYLHRLAGPNPTGVGTDGQLLEQFVTRRDEAAFAALVRRHGPLVWGVCRRLLRHTQDAEDSFQATFLVLARRAGSVGKRESVRSFLYGVAYRVAVRARGTARRRQTRQVPLEDVAALEPDGTGPDLRPVLDEEIGRLPEKYRLPLILCHLEGRTQEEAAQLLGCPRATVATRLARGKDRLRARLTRRGLDVSTSGFAAALREAAAPPVPDAVAETTVRAAAAGSAAPRATVLAEEVLRTMLLTRWKTAVVVLLALGVAGSGAGILVSRTQAPAPADEPRTEAKPAGPAPAPDQPANPPATQEKPSKQVAPRSTAPAPPVPGKPQPEAAVSIAHRLGKRIQFAGFEADPKMTLQEALDNLADRYEISFDVNEAAFQADGVKDVLSEPVAKKAIPKMMNVPLGTVLRKILARVRSRSGVALLIHDGTIELTTQAAVVAQLGRTDRYPLLPLVYVEVRERLLEEVLQQLAEGTGYGVVVDPHASDQAQDRVTVTLPNVPLDTAVRVLAELGGLDVVRMDNVFYVTTPENAARLRAEQERQQPAPPAAIPKDAGKRARP